MLTIIQKNKISVQDIRHYMNYLLDKSAQDESVRALAINITSGKSDNISAVFDWVKTNIKYVPDATIAGSLGSSAEDPELFISPIRMVRDYNEGKPLSGDCDDQSLMCVALYRALGMRANGVLLDRQGKGFDHAVCEVESPTLGMITVDTTGNTPLGWEENYNQKEII